MKIKDFFNKIKSVKHFEIYIAVLLIIIAIIMCLSTLKKESDVPEEKSEIESTLSKIEGVGECVVMVSYNENSYNSEPIGAIVVCDGANDLKVVENVTIALKTLLNINPTNIKVYKTKS